VPQWLVDLFSRYGYAVVFVGVLLENAGVPVPGETTLLAGAALAQMGRLSLLWVIVCATCGVLGDNIGFAIGRRGGRKLAEHHGPKIGLTPARCANSTVFRQIRRADGVHRAFQTGLRVFCAVPPAAADFSGERSCSTTPGARVVHHHRGRRLQPGL
jgi:hypothetical protein